MNFINRLIQIKNSIQSNKGWANYLVPIFSLIVIGAGFWYLISIGVALKTTKAAGDFSVHVINNLVKLYNPIDPYADLSLIDPDLIKTEVSIKAAKGELEPFQLVIVADGVSLDPLEDVAITFSPLVGITEGVNQGLILPETNIETFYEYYSLIEHQTDDIGIEGYWPDALIPLISGKTFNINHGENQPIWVRVKIPEGQNCGEYAGIITVSTTNADQIKIPITLKVWNFELYTIDQPGTTSLKTSFGLGKSAFTSSDFYNLPDPTVKLDEYIIWLLEQKIGVGGSGSYFPGFASIGSWNGSNIETNFSQVDAKFRKYIDSYNASSYTFPLNQYIAGVKSQMFECLPGDIDCEEIDPGEYYLTRFSDEWYARVREYVRQVSVYFEANGWLDEMYTYILDELYNCTDYALMNQWNYIFNPLIDDIEKPSVMVLEQITNKIFGGCSDTLLTDVDIWNPAIDVFLRKAPRGEGGDESVYDGETWWWYNGGAGEWPNIYTLDRESIYSRIIPWFNYRVGAEGYYAWALTYWGNNIDNPWTNPKLFNKISYCNRYYPGTICPEEDEWWLDANTAFPNGDGFLLYPPVVIDGFMPTLAEGSAQIPSIRLEMLREGMEDYEYMMMAGHTFSDPIVNDVTKPDYTNFTNTTPQEFFIARELLGEELSDEPIIVPKVFFASATSTVNEDMINHSVDVLFDIASASLTPITVDYQVENITAEHLHDYQITGTDLTTGTLTFNTGETLQTIFLDIINDLNPEDDETFKITLTGSSGADLDNPIIHTVNIIDDDRPKVFFASATSVVNENIVNHSVDVLFDIASASLTPITVDYQVENITAEHLHDYQITGTESTMGTLTFNTGETLQTIFLDIINDLNPEDDETFKITLTGSSGADLDNPIIHTVTIIDDDRPKVFFASATSTVNEDMINHSVDVLFDIASASLTPITVDYQVENITAEHLHDYQITGTDLTTGTLTFNTGETLQTIFLDIINDLNPEDDETFKITLTGSSGADLDNPIIHTVNIIDDDRPKVFFASATSVVNENIVNHSVDVLFDIASASLTPITVDYQVENITAEHLHDYQITGTESTMGTLTFNTGETLQTIFLDIINDLNPEDDETFKITLTGSSGADLDNPIIHTVTIIDDDRPKVFFASATSTVNEDMINHSVDVLFDIASASLTPITVDYQVENITAEHLHDYQITGTDLTTGTLTFNTGETLQTIFLDIINDLNPEDDETFKITLTGSSGADLDNPIIHTVNIIDDDRPKVFFASATSTVNEDMINHSVDVLFDIASASLTPITVDYQVENITAEHLHDYQITGTESTMGTLTFNTGETLQTIFLDIINDLNPEDDETFKITLTGSSGADLDNPIIHTVNIIDDDRPKVFFASATSTVNEDMINHSVDVLFDIASASLTPITVDYQVENITAEHLHDYQITGTDLTTGTLTFNTGETLQTIFLDIINDLNPEDDETFKITLTGSSGADLDNPIIHTVTIIDDDRPKVFFASATSTVNEDMINHSVDVLFDIASASLTPITVDYQVENITAEHLHDYQITGTDLTTGTLTFNTGETLQTIFLDIINDLNPEDDETFKITLTGSSGADLDNPIIHTVNIIDDDRPKVFFASATSVVNENIVNHSVDVLFDIASASLTPITVDYQVENITAEHLHDYQITGTESTMGTLTFNTGETLQTIFLDIINDLNPEDDETFKITLTGSSGADLDNPIIHTVNIIDDDRPKVFFASATSTVNEDMINHSVDVLFDIASASLTPITVDYQVENITAEHLHDYQITGTDLTTGTLTFNTGETLQTIFLDIINDLNPEDDETFKITLTGSSGADLDNPIIHTVNIIDDDRPKVFFASATSTVNEDMINHSVDVLFDIASASLTPITVDYQVENITAEHLHDYQITGTESTMGTLTFNTGETLQTIFLDIINDLNPEDDETFKITLTGSSGADLDNPIIHTVTIIDDDRPKVFFASATSTVNEDMINHSVDVLFDIASASLTPITVDYQVENITAEHLHDYQITGTDLTTGTLTFNTGETLQTIFLDIINDLNPEDDETFKITLTGSSGADLDNPIIHTVTIIDDDPSSYEMYGTYTSRKILINDGGTENAYLKSFDSFNPIFDAPENSQVEFAIKLFDINGDSLGSGDSGEDGFYIISNDSPIDRLNQYIWSVDVNEVQFRIYMYTPDYTNIDLAPWVESLEFNYTIQDDTVLQTVGIISFTTTDTQTVKKEETANYEVEFTPNIEFHPLIDLVTLNTVVSEPNIDVLPVEIIIDHNSDSYLAIVSLHTTDQSPVMDDISFDITVVITDHPDYMVEPNPLTGVLNISDDNDINNPAITINASVPLEIGLSDDLSTPEFTLRLYESTVTDPEASEHEVSGITADSYDDDTKTATLQIDIEAGIVTNNTTYTSYIRTTRHLWDKATANFTVNINDLTYDIEFPKLTIGDISLDNVINSFDFGIAIGEFGQDLLLFLADFNNDGVVNAVDIGLLFPNWFKRGVLPSS